jgi:peptidoglycan/xylan/chitin deacetylase (PgdA/CDA1 family)
VARYFKTKRIEMGILRTAKLATLELGKSVGVFDALKRSEWRKNQLLILGYHGVSQADEHLWNPRLYISPEYFRSRMNLLNAYGCNVLPLADALQSLWTKTLPPCSVVLTFDDGFCDLYSQALPILKEFGWSATVYLTSYYAFYNRPVFDVMCSYLLWKGRGAVVDASELIDQKQVWDLRNDSGRSAAALAVRKFARDARYSAKEKDKLLTALASRLSIDYESILSKRILHLLNKEEVAQLAASGVDIQLHTHRHYSPNHRESFLCELEENRSFIKQIAKIPRHFCYPNGHYEADKDAWLRESDVSSATTCEPGLASNYSNPYRLPRLVDSSSMEFVELEGWISGFSKFLPHKAILRDDDSIPPFYY